MTAVGVALKSATRAVRYVGRNSAGSPGGALTITQPAEIQEGDFGLLLFRAAPTIVPPGDWESIHTSSYWKLYDEAEGSVSISSNTTKVAGALAVFRGVHQSDPVDQVSIKSNSPGATATTTPITATVDGVLVNVVLMSGQTGSTVVEIDYGQRVVTAGYQDRRGAIAFGPPIHAGETSKVATWTAAATHTGATAIQFVLRRGEAA